MLIYLFIFSSFSLTQQDHGAEFIADALSVNRSLQKLELWGCSIHLPGLAAIANVLTKNSPLESINLGYNDIGSVEGIELLTKAMLGNKYLRELNLAASGMQSEGAVALAGVIAESRYITRLDLRHNNIGTAGLMAISVAMKINTSVVQVAYDEVDSQVSVY